MKNQLMEQLPQGVTLDRATGAEMREEENVCNQRKIICQQIPGLNDAYGKTPHEQNANVSNKVRPLKDKFNVKNANKVIDKFCEVDSDFFYAFNCGVTQ